MRRRSVSASLACAALLLVYCSDSAKEGGNSSKKNEVIVPKAEYTASQTPGEVIITARGSHPTGGYQTKLVQSPLRIWPPQYLLAMKKPDGPATQAITPFEVTASFKATDPIKVVVVTDGAGKHDVKVDQARD